MHRFPYLSLGLPHRREPGEPPSPLRRIPAPVLELQVCSRRKDRPDAVPPALPAPPTAPARRALLGQGSRMLSKAQAPANLPFTLQFLQEKALLHRAQFLFARDQGLTHGLCAGYKQCESVCTQTDVPSPAQAAPRHLCGTGVGQKTYHTCMIHEHVFIYRSYKLPLRPEIQQSKSLRVI